MRHLLAAILALSLLAPAVQAQQSAIPRVIQDQIAAFQADDFGAAFTHASPSIKRMFGSPERFGRMVRNGYPMVYRPQDVTMLEQRPSGPGVVQRVLIRDQSGQLHTLDYQMIDTESGWLINGVRIVDAPGVGA